jgi:hypothetical protein
MLSFLVKIAFDSSFADFWRFTESLLTQNQENRVSLTPCFCYSCKRLPAQLLSFDTHANAPGSGIPLHINFIFERVSKYEIRNR